MYFPNQKIKILCHTPNGEQWKDGTFTNKVAATDREYRINCRLSTGQEIREAAPECVKPAEKAVKVIFEDEKYNYSTSVNPFTSDKMLENYFIGKYFDVGSYPKENFQKCITIEIF